MFATYYGENRLYWNNAGPSDPASRVRYNTGWAFIDYDNDGHLDLSSPITSRSIRQIRRNQTRTRIAGIVESTLIADLEGCLSIVTCFIATTATLLSAMCLILRYRATPSLLYLNQGDGKFTEEAPIRGAAYDENGKALRDSALRDLYGSKIRSILYRNTAAATFEDVSERGRPKSARAPPARQSAAYRWKADARDEIRSRGSYLSQNDLRRHFGLGVAATVDKIEVLWPSGSEQLLENVAADIVNIREPESETRSWR